MTDPTEPAHPVHIVIGLMPETLDPAEASRIITLAAEAMSLCAAFSAEDPVIMGKLLVHATRTYNSLSQDAQDKLATLGHEIIEAAMADKHFFALARFAEKPNN